MVQVLRFFFHKPIGKFFTHEEGKKRMKNANLKKLAKESAIDAINALLCPWIEQVADEYTVEVK